MIKKKSKKKKKNIYLEKSTLVMKTFSEISFEHFKWIQIFPSFGQLKFE